jgi:hypothetical protein
MKAFRNAFSIAVAGLLFVGYLASVFEAFEQQQVEYGAKVDQPPIVWLALAILLISIVLAFLKEKDEQA